MANKLKENQLIGVTESSEIAFNLDAFDRLYKGNIIITKRLTDKLIEKLVEHKDKIILHCCVTGMGGSRIEPFVPTYEETFIKCQSLIENGFESVEACGEPGIDSIPCLSQKDIDILGLTEEIVLEGSAEQRKSCGCPANKKELLKIKPKQCQNGCVYCFWK